MKWISHKVTTFAIYYTVSENPIPSLVASASSTLPDLIEMGPGRLVFRHRGISHNPIFWLIVLLIAFYSIRDFFSKISIISLPLILEPRPLLLAIASGVALHLVEDSLSYHGIPVIGNKRISLKIYKTFTFSEFYLVLLTLLICSGYLIIRRKLL